MKREELTKLGLEKAVIDAIMDMHGADVTALKNETEALKSDNIKEKEKVAVLEKTQEELQKNNEELQKSKDESIKNADNLAKELETAKKENESFKESIRLAEEKAKKEAEDKDLTEKIAAAFTGKEFVNDYTKNAIFQQVKAEYEKQDEKTRDLATINQKSGRAICGLSMGGFHSLHISKQYPDMFDYVGLFSAAIIPNENAKSPVYEDLEGKLKIQFDKKPRLYWIAIGKTDFLYKANQDYLKLLDEKGYKYTYYETGEGHIWRNWRIYLSEFVTMLFK